MVSRQYRSRQFIPATRGLATCDFPYKGRDYKRVVAAIAKAWKYPLKMEPFDEKPRVTPEYRRWRNRRIDDEVPIRDSEVSIPLEEQLRVNPSDMEIVRQDFEGKYINMEMRLSRLENEKKTN